MLGGFLNHEQLSIAGISKGNHDPCSQKVVSKTWTSFWFVCFKTWCFFPKSSAHQGNLGNLLMYPGLRPWEFVRIPFPWQIDEIDTLGYTHEVKQFAPEKWCLENYFAFFKWSSGGYVKLWGCIWLHLDTRWWFQIFVMFIPTWGNDPIWRIFFRWVETTHPL